MFRFLLKKFEMGVDFDHVNYLKESYDISNKKVFEFLNHPFTLDWHDKVLQNTSMNSHMNRRMKS